MNKQLNKRGIVRLWLTQLAIIITLAVFCLVLINTNAAVSAMLGGMVYLVPNAYFASKLFKHQGARAARQIVSSFYKAEALKIILSMLLFTAVFILYRIQPAVFFASYIVMLMTHWLAPWIIVNKLNRPESD